MSNNVVTIQKQATAIQTNLEPKSLDDLIKYAQLIANSKFVPSSFDRKPENVIVAVQLGVSVGLSVAQSLQHIAIINGKPSLYGDAMLALCCKSDAFEWIDEQIENEDKNQQEWIAVCKVKRKGYPKAIVSKFSWKQAEIAGLVKKIGPWQTYPERMLKFRARGFALRDAFPDLLNGFISQDEAADYPTQTIEPPPVQLQSRPFVKPEVIHEMPVIGQEKPELIKKYDWLIGQLTDIESRERLEKLTSQSKIITLRAELSENEPELAGVINDLIEQALASFEAQGELANAV